MNLGYVTTYDAANVRNWSGLGYYKAQALEKSGVSIDFIGSLRQELPLFLRLKRKSYSYFLRGRRYSLDRDSLVLKNYARQIHEQLRSLKTDIVFSPGTIPIALLECDQPLVFWTDATFGGMIDFYPEFTNLCGESIRQGNLIEQTILNRCQLAIYSSEWAARTAIDLYKADPSKVKVVPYGANLDSRQDLSAIKSLINTRSEQQCNLLFIGVDWQRKGGNIALEVAEQLNQAGLPTKLTIVGCEPDIDRDVSNFVEIIKFIDKSSQQGVDAIGRLLAESHFLILPSVADCTPVVFSEANSFGVPCLASDVGGIGTIIKDNINGKTFARTAEVSEYCTYIFNLIFNFREYKELAFSSFNEYQSRLNWEVSGRAVKKLLENLL